MIDWLSEPSSILGLSLITITIAWHVLVRWGLEP